MTWRALALALLFGIPLADSVYQIPVQASEVVDIVQDVGDTPDVASSFLSGLRASSTMLRPMRQVHTKLLLELVERSGAGYHLVFRGVHATLSLLLVVIFVLACRPRSFADLCAAACGLAVLTGLHTFTGLFREAYPVNHFLVVTLYGWIVLLLAQRGKGIWSDALAAVCVALALLTLESGILVAVVAAASHAGGWRGISKRGLLLIGVVLLAYVALRVGYLGMEPPRFAERAIGFGLGALSSEEQIARFGDRRTLLYGYNIVSAASSVLFSQPSNGRFTLVEAWQIQRASPWMFIQLVASLATTGVIIWNATRPGTGRRAGYSDPRYLVAAAVIVVNAALSYAYAKDEIIAFAGTFYAFAGYAAARDLLAGLAPDPRRAAAGTTLACALMALWATRVAGLHVVLREQAFFVRHDWVAVQGTGGATNAIRAEALGIPSASPRAWPAWVKPWLGER